jgi:YD repeat-containing protein
VEVYVLDIQDRPISISNVEGQTMSIEYGVADFVRSVTRFDGSIVSNQYDSAGRLSEVYYPDQTNRFEYYKNGLARSSRNKIGAVSNIYSIANRLVETYGVSPNSELTYTYFGAGQVSNMVSVAGTSTYTYDAADRLTSIDAPGGNFAYAFNTNNGLVASMIFSTNALVANYQYDVLDRLVSIEWLNASNDVLKSFTYDYDAAGMITNVEREAGERITYTYDSLDRLTGETHRNSSSSIVSSESYAYDQVGNRLSKSHDGLSLVYC